jgi:hypothetical protein
VRHISACITRLHPMLQSFRWCPWWRLTEWYRAADERIVRIIYIHWLKWQISIRIGKL